MANNFTPLIPVIYEALDVVPRELIGAIGAVQLDPSAENAAVGQTIRSHVVPQGSLVDIVPGITNQNGQSQTISNVDVTLTKAKTYAVQWNGDEQLSLGSQYAGILRDQFAQAYRTLANAMEADIVNAVAAGSSRAVGTAGTTPFAVANDLSDWAYAGKLLDDNGAPMEGRSVIMGTTAAAALKAKQSLLLKLNESGSADLLRNGNISAMPIEGFTPRVSGQIKTGAAVGTGSGYVVAAGGAAFGATTITLATGSGTILAGDVVTIGNYKYVVTVGITAPGAITIAAPGLQETVAAAATVTVNAASVKNVILQKNGFVLASRLPAMPQGGDAASDVMVVTDPVSGLSFQLAMYKQYRQVVIEVGAVWGTKVIRPEYCGLILG